MAAVMTTLIGQTPVNLNKIDIIGRLKNPASKTTTLLFSPKGDKMLLQRKVFSLAEFGEAQAA